MAKKVFIGVGHGGSDPGAVANGIKESSANLDVAKACAEVLKAHGVNVLLSRISDVSENLSARIKECNAFNPDLAADIHHNAGGGDGAEIYHAKNDKTDDTLAQNILDEIVKIGQNSRGMKTKLTSSGADYFGFIRQVKCPSVLVECAFLDNKTDVKIIDTRAEREKMGEAIAKGFLKTLGITYKEKAENKPTSTTQKKEIYRVRKSWEDEESQTGAFSVLDNAIAQAKKDKLNVYDSSGKEVYTYKETTKAVTKGCKVKIKKGAKDYNGKKVASFVYDNVYKVDELNGKRAVLDKQGICTAFHTDNLIVQ